jgi:hypothetical protein
MADELWASGSYFGAWQPGLFAWELREPSRFPQPIPWRGVLGLFDVPDSLADF